MHMPQKMSLLALTAALLLGTGAKALNAADPESVQTVPAAVSDAAAPAAASAQNDKSAVAEETRAAEETRSADKARSAEETRSADKAADAVAAAKTAPPIEKFSATQDIVHLDGTPIQPVGYNINGENYFKLRDIAHYMNGTQASFSVGYDEATNSIALQTGAPYQPEATDMAPAAVKPSAQPSAAKVQLNGKPVAMTAYLIGGSNYFRLKEIGAQLGFRVDYIDKIITLRTTPLVTYTVSFDMNGQGAQLAPITAEEHTKLAMPAAPTAAGCVFGGWYQDAPCTTVWDFKTNTVSADMKLYAKWSRTFTMTYHMNGQGAQVRPQTGILSDTFATEPPVPIAEGFTFGGWYIESSCNTPWVFNVDTVSSDIAVYARWTNNNNGMVEEDLAEGDVSDTPPPTPNVVGAIDGTLTILLDPGHGGTDSGAVGNGMNENALNLEVAQYLRQLFTQAGVNVVMSRESTSTTLYGVDRKNYVLDICSKGNIDLVLSIHHNSFNKKSRGAEILTQSAAQDPRGASKELGRLMLAEYQKIGQTSRGVTDGSDKYMIYAPATYRVPSVLSEFCFLDNASDAAKIDSAQERRAEAQAIFNAVMKYYQFHAY